VIELRLDQVLGRGQNVELRVDNPKVSAQHARIRWRKTHWELTDLGSRNGTFLDQRRLAAGEQARLERDGRLAFGDPLDEWHVVDELPPEAASHTTGVVTETQQRDPAAPRVDQIKLSLSVSSDEETVAAVIFHAGGVAELPSSALHYLLLTLARQRLEDRENGAPEGEQGWIYGDDLCARLKLDASHLNVTIFRLRKQLERLGVAEASRIIERRRPSGQLRIGVAALSIRSTAR
jgi:hypothetical protein